MPAFTISHGSPMHIVRHAFALSVFLVAGVHAQQASFFSSDGKMRVAEFVRMRNDSITVRITAPDRVPVERTVPKSTFTKVVFATGEYLNLSLRDYPPATDGWDDVGVTQAQPAAPAVSDAKPTVAIADFDGRGVQASDATTLSERFREKLIATGQFRVMERNEMNLILREQGFQQSGACADNECLVEMGQIIAVRKIISGAVAKVGGIYTVSVRLLDVQSGAIDKTLSEDCDCPLEQLLMRTMERLANRLAGLDTSTTSAAIQITRGDAALFVKTDQPGARVYVDGKLVDGVTPLTIENLPAGSHLVRVTKGDLTASTGVALESHKVTRVALRLEQQGTVLKVSSTPTEAEVFVDRPRTRGRKPDQLTPAIFEGLGADSVALTLFRVGYRDTTVILALTPNEENAILVAMTAAADDAVKQQQRFVRDRKGLRAARVLTAGSLVCGAAGALFMYLGQRDFDDAQDAAETLKTSTLKAGDAYEDALERNHDETASGEVKSTVAAALFGLGGAALAVSIVFYF
jgi:TolB-like protein